MAPVTSKPGAVDRFWQGPVGGLYPMPGAKNRR